MAGALRRALERTARLREPPPSPAPAAPTPASTPGARSSTSTCRRIAYDGPGLARALNRQLAPEIVVRRAEAVDPDFDARRSATGRTYRYLVWNAPGARPAAGPRGLARARPARPGRHAHGDATCCSASTTSAPSAGAGRARPASEPIVRRVTRAQWCVDQGPEAADAGMGAKRERTSRPRSGRGSGTGTGWRRSPFALRDRRQLVLPPDGALAGGRLVEVGRGRENAAGLMERLRATCRDHMPDPAPAHGLCLVSVDYGLPGLELRPSAAPLPG